MALFTSYYTRQLALRPEAVPGGDYQQEGEKAVQASVARRTVDYAAPYVLWLQVGRGAGAQGRGWKRGAREPIAHRRRRRAVLHAPLTLLPPSLHLTHPPRARVRRSGCWCEARLT